MKLDSGVYSILHRAEGVLSLREPPVPKEWDTTKRPHVALLQRHEDSVVRFFLSDPAEGDGELDACDLTVLPHDSVIEVRYSQTDYRYYKRREYDWTKVAEIRDPFITELDVYEYGSVPIRFTLDEDIPATARRTGDEDFSGEKH
ncbi:MAG: hypothetical protein GF309_13220 [Candidatus Lokiarchaeota archaeon]|nr:hypothetical protein [Candidatus Lokiarchaeota archaeon]